MDIKILKIGLLATAAILAPVATMMIQYELREDEEHEFEGEIELVTKETVTLTPEETQTISTPKTPASVGRKESDKTWRRKNKFRDLAHCLRFFPRCRSKKENKVFDKVPVNWAKSLTSGRGENRFISMLKIR